ncbi:MAG: hypothetical protein HQM02_02635 [Magnetococcales bacterium]|nr:hypothetical protein [Magnetococcales bacterium]
MNWRICCGCGLGFVAQEVGEVFPGMVGKSVQERWIPDAARQPEAG